MDNRQVMQSSYLTVAPVEMFPRRYNIFTAVSAGLKGQKGRTMKIRPIAIPLNDSLHCPVIAYKTDW